MNKPVKIPNSIATRAEFWGSKSCEDGRLRHLDGRILLYATQLRCRDLSLQRLPVLYWFLRFLVRHSMYWFVGYRIVLGVVVLVLLSTGVVAAS